MFKRSPDVPALEADTQQSIPLRKSPVHTSPMDPTDVQPSVIGCDLTIAGDRIQVSSTASLQVDGTIEGDVRGVHVSVGRHGIVQGMITAESVEVLGRVVGRIQGTHVTLRSSATIIGDIHHQSLTIDIGATFNGQATRSDGSTDLANSTDRSHIQQQAAP